MKKVYTKIIRIGIYIGKLTLNIIYFFIKMFPTKNKVVMLSRQSNMPSLDFELIKKEILKRNSKIEIKMLCKVIKKDVGERIKYCFYILKCMYHIATSKVCILDGYSIPISILKHKKSLEIIQIWHASGALKKFGYQSLGKKEGRGTGVAKIMNMHKNYSHVMAPSNATAKIYEEAFGIERDKIFINGLPRLDYILDNNIKNEKLKEFYRDYPKYKNKKTILYVPTYRKNTSSKKNIKELIKAVNKKKYNLIIRLHPLDKSKEANKYSINKKYNTYDLLKISNYIITDYSAVAFEACLLNKPIYFYLYDINDYKKNRGLNVDLFKEMNNATSTNIKEIIEAIDNNKYDYGELENFKNKYIEDLDCNNTKRLVEFIFGYLNEGSNNGNKKENKKLVNEYSKEKFNI